ncbi:PREDICTED: uncharacterized protein LOC105948607 [Erythranthe guttata]|uniref:uncharacterized protein LOC105948607 n=1 Tax=Erythranthe guttata TaxID=4155 RepID=UPI00064D9647|nr:PREDICTED: uncharacterized protein LOC105948607 [Erythranthe guttata]|eukprot:XP_012827279.1 PREDICTED: uncharacterized protein LOC105948607 [Erythranthe guttata]
MKELWQSAPFGNLNQVEQPNFRMWLQYLMHSLDKDLVRWAIIVMWKIWDNRNKYMHNEPMMNSEEIVRWSKSYLDAYSHAQFQQPSTAREDHPSKWKPPSPDLIKINVDAAFPPDQDYYMTSMVPRDHNGKCIRWRRELHPGRPPPAVGEAHAALLAMRLAIELGWQSIITESDCLHITESLKEGVATSAPYGIFIEDCLTVLPLFQCCIFSFAKRTGNCLANAIAKATDLNCYEGYLLPLNLAIFA